MSDNPSIAAVLEEIRIRTEELEALKNALTVLQSDRQAHVHIVAGNLGQFAISHVYTPTNGNGSVDVGAGTIEVEVARIPTPAGENSRERTARLLTHFDRQTPRSLEDVATRAGVSTRMISVGVLMKHKYLKRKGGGFVRTAKDYTP